MPVEHAKRQPSVSRALYERLERMVNLHPTGLSVVSRYTVYNPHPEKYELRWSLPNRINIKKRFYSAEVVTAEDAHKLYLIPEDEIDKGKNCAMRDGQVLMRYPKEAAEVRTLFGVYRDLQSTSKYIQNFENDRNIEARRIDENGRPQKVASRGRRKIADPRTPGGPLNRMMRAADRQEHELAEEVDGVRVVDGSSMGELDDAGE